MKKKLFVLPAVALLALPAFGFSNASAATSINPSSENPTNITFMDPPPPENPTNITFMDPPPPENPTNITFMDPPPPENP
ncbi:hypothetical protein, partial [Bacillus sp. AFS075034]|uniref:hypothetical protein n=1 Tax=Bacillus sp. AFS075034 TaxID=2034281 RepID=UPI001C3F466C